MYNQRLEHSDIGSVVVTKAFREVTAGFSCTSRTSKRFVVASFSKKSQQDKEVEKPDKPFFFFFLITNNL